MHHESIHNQLTEALKTCKRAFAYTVFFGFIVSFLTLATSIYSMQVFDRVLSSGSYQTLIALTIIMVIFSVILNFMQAVRSSITNKAGEFVDKKLSALTIDLSFKSLKNDASKQTISQNIRDLHTIRNFIASQNLISVVDAPWSIIFIIVIFLIHPLVGATVLVGAFILLFLAYLNDKHTKKLSAKSAELSSHCYKELDVMAKNVEAIAALKMKDHLINNWNEFNKKNLQTAAELHHQSNVISNITKFFRGLIYILTVAFGAYLVINNKMSSGGIMACSILSAKALMPFDAAISLWNVLLNSKKSYERLNKLISENYSSADKITFPEPQGNLDIERVGYIAPRSSKPIIKGVNISIKAGEVVAIIGPTASGKSTLAKLLVGVANPSTGHIRLDGAELSHWKDEDLAKYIGYLPQDIELFNGSVKSNIARMDKKAKDEDIIAATKISHCHNMILKLDKGYETDIGVWGANISGGQRQRIALARAFYGNPKLVVLDEPNSNLDQEGEAALSQCLKMAKEKNITVIIISHRQNILEAVDKILVMHNGEAKLFGPKLEVLKSLNAKQIES